MKRDAQLWLIAAQITLISASSFAQKHDYTFIDRPSEIGSGVSIVYLDSLSDVVLGRFSWNGTVARSPILSDKNGMILGYFNSRNVYDSIGRKAINGDSMAVGYYLNYLFSFYDEDFGLGNGGNCAFIPINDSLFYLFYKAPHLWIGEPGFAIDFEEKGVRLSSYSENLYLTKVRLNADRRLYIREGEKHLELIEGLFQYRDLMFCKHTNGLDWWLVTSNAMDNMAARARISTNGSISILEDVEFSDNFWRVRSASNFVFSEDGTMLARILVRSDTAFQHIFEFFHFDRCTGVPERILVDSLPLTERFTSAGDLEFSANGRFLYAAIGEVILQMDLHDPDFFQNRDTIGLWDGFLYAGLLPPLFDALWRLPNGKILVASSVATPYLHYIHSPDLPGELCDFEQRARQAPPDPLNAPYRVFINSLPVFPPFRMAPLDAPCTTEIEDRIPSLPIEVYPNPTYDVISISRAEGLDLHVLNVQGQYMLHRRIPEQTERYDLDISAFVPGVYVFVFTDTDGKIVERKKCVKM